MNKIKLPDFITFEKFNNETMALISKKELEVNKLNVILSYKMFLDIFVKYPRLKSFKIHGECEAADSWMLTSVDTISFEGKVRSEFSLVPLLSDILGEDNYRRISEICEFEFGRNVESCNKLKAVFDIKNLSDEDIDKIVGGDLLSFKNDVFAIMNDINKLHNQVIVIKILTLFKNNNNLKRINFEFKSDVIDYRNICIKVLFDDAVVDTKDIGEIKNILVDRKFYDPSLWSYTRLGINRNKFADIKNLIKYVVPNGDDFSSVLEKEILEENIGSSINNSKAKKI